MHSSNMPIMSLDECRSNFIIPMAANSDHKKYIPVKSY